MNDTIGPRPDQQVDRVHARQRLGIEREHELRMARPMSLLRFRKVMALRAVTHAALWLTGLHGRARRNADRVVVRQNDVRSARLPAGFDGYTLLHLTDLHADISAGAMRQVATLVAGLRYDACVLTGDYRGRTYGAIEAAMATMAPVCAALTGPVYGVLGNHDSLTMLPALDAMGVTMLMNESIALRRGDDTLWLAGVDDAHFFRLDNIEKAATRIPEDGFAILLSHTPEVFRQAAHAGFDLMLSGHTHGGQICLPGGFPVTRGGRVPRRVVGGAWRHQAMCGYTSTGAGVSVVPLRLNCPPEITLHTLRRA